MCKQTVKDFEWLVVDDGSTDNTRAEIESYKKLSDFPIRYIYKQNGGKHTALNVGIKTIQSKLTFIVDSDDSLTSDAVEIVLRYHERYDGEDGLCGYSFLRRFPDGKTNGKPFVVSETIDTYINARINADDMMADKAEIFYTKCLVEFPFPIYKSENFLGEDIVWIRMARKYVMVHINKVIYIGDYQEDGLTKNRRLHNLKSPNGCMHRAMEFMKPDICLKFRIKGSLQYVVYGKFAGYKLKTLLEKSPDKKLTLFAYIPGSILHEKWKREYVD